MPLDVQPDKPLSNPPLGIVGTTGAGVVVGTKLDGIGYIVWVEGDNIGWLEGKVGDNIGNILWMVGWFGEMKGAPDGDEIVATDGTALAPYERLKLSKSVYDGSVGQPSSWLKNFNVYEWPGIKLVTTCFQDIPAVPGQVLSIFQATLPTVLSNNVAFAQSKVTESGQIILYQNDSWVWSDAATKVWLTTELASRGIDEPSMAQLPL